MAKPWFEIFNIKPWFEVFEFEVKAVIRYTDKEGQIKPYLSAFLVGFETIYPELKYILITVFPQSRRLELIYENKDNYVIAKVPIKYTGLAPHSTSIEETFDNMDIPDYVKDYLKRVLKFLLDNIYVRDDPLKFLSALLKKAGILDNNALDDELPKLTQTIHVYGMIDDRIKSPEELFNINGKKDIGKVEIMDYFAINGKTEYEDIYDFIYIDDDNEVEYHLPKKSFVIQKSSNGEELTAIEKIDDKELFNPIYQEVLSVIIPTRIEFEDLVRFVKDTIKESEVEYGDKNIVYS
jgi:hypothetical protein